MREKVIAAVDLGASGGKVFLGFFQGKSLKMREVHRFPNEPVCVYARDGNSGERVSKLYWNPLSIYSGIVDSFKKMAREGVDCLDSLGIDTWGADGMLFNRHGEMTGPLYNYRDHRLDEIRRELFRSISERELYMKTGVPSLQFNQVNQLFWLSRHRPEELEGAAYFLPVSSLFYHLLGGGRFCEYTWGSTTQLLDPYKKNWCPEIFERLRLPISVMPEIVPPGAHVGEVYGELLAEAGLKGCRLTAAATHDTASAYYAAPAENHENALIISSGTWSLAGKMVPEPVINDFSFKKGFTNEGGVEGIRFLRNIMGTWILQELRRGWEREDGKKLDWDNIVGMACGGEGFNSYIDPDDDSFYNPDSMENAVKEFCVRSGQRVPEGRESVLRTVFESLAMKCRLVNEEIEEATDSKNRFIHIVGGGARNRLLNRFIAEATGLKVYAGPFEATGAGNILVQAVALGIIPTHEEARKMAASAFDVETFEPENAGEWTKAFREFKKQIY